MWHPYFIAKFYQIEMLCFPTPHPPIPPTTPIPQPPWLPHRVVARHHIDGCDLKDMPKPRPTDFHGI